VISLCKTALLDNLNNYLQQGGRKVSTWQKSLNHVYVDFSETPDAFTNINTIEDLNHLTLKLNHV
jgi:molybdopterin-guanine dinucleotide biosynthesis protein A